MSETERHPVKPWLVAAAGVLLLAAGLRWVLLWGLDLSDLPGPGGVQFLALALDPTPGDPPLPALVFRWAIQLSMLEPVAAVHLLGVASSVLGIAGAMAAAWALLGRHAAIGCGVLLACWSQHAQQALLLGMDAPAGGLAWAGLGLAYWGARTKLRGLPLAAIGGLLLALGAGLKPTAMPVLALAALVPLLAWGPWWQALASTAAVVAGAALGPVLLAPFATAAPDVQTVVPAVGDLLQGWEHLSEQGSSEPEGALAGLAGLAVLVALFPFPRWPQRLLVLAITVVVLGYASHSLGDWLRPRYLVPAFLGLFMLAGDALGRPARYIPFYRPLGWLPLAGIALLMLFDSLAFHQAWSVAREPAVGTADHRLPAAPTPWTWRYQDLFWDSSLSTQGAVSLMALAREAPSAGVAVLPLQDGRHAHAEAAAAMAGVPVLLLEEQRCCPEGQHAVLCARETLAALDRAGALVVLLPARADLGRIPKQSFAWVQSLQGAAWSGDAISEHDAWWAVIDGSGDGGELPCSAHSPRQPPRP